MGTNFYAVSEEAPISVHVGKRWAMGGGKMGFIWAIPMGAMEGFAVFHDEYGEVLLRTAMTEVLASVSEHQFHSIGLEFS